MDAAQTPTAQEVLRILDLRKDVKEMYLMELNQGGLKGVAPDVVRDLLFLASTIADAVGAKKFKVDQAPSLSSLREFKEKFANEGDQDDVIGLISQAREVLREAHFGEASYKEIVGLCLSVADLLGNCDFDDVLSGLPNNLENLPSSARTKDTNATKEAEQLAAGELLSQVDMELDNELAELERRMASPLVRLQLTTDEFVDLAKRAGEPADERFQNALVYLKDNCNVAPETVIKIVEERKDSTFEEVTLDIVNTLEASEYFDIEDDNGKKTRIHFFEVEAEGLSFVEQLKLADGRYTMSYDTLKQLKGQFADLQDEGSLDDGSNYKQALACVIPRLKKGDNLDERLKALCEQASNHTPPVMTFRDAIEKGLVRE